MKMQVLEFWRERLKEGKIFSNKGFVEEGYDIRTSRGGTRDWPERVAKDSLYNNFLAWAGKRGISVKYCSVGDFYRHLEPIAYPYGKNWHTVRHRVHRLSVYQDQTVMVASQRAFMRLVPIEIALAWCSLASARGTMSQREEWRETVRAYARSVGADVAAVPQG